MIATSFRPLPRWPYPETQRRRLRPFSASWLSTLRLLDREIRLLDGSAVIIAAGFRERDLRLTDGWPRADARQPDHPGVEISFDSRHGRLVYATDVCDHWQHNVRSIALGLEALRAVDRFGVSRRGEQYAGWRELPAGIAAEAPMDRTEALDVVAGFLAPGDVLHPKDPESLRRAIRRAVRRTHPDNGGDPEAFRRVQRAREVLEAR